MPAAPTTDRAWPTWLVLVLVAAGLLLRLGIALVSHGTNDAAAFYGFGAGADRWGLLEAYRQVPFLNHPPAVLAWTAATYRLVGGDDLTFPFVFKLPVLLAEGLIAWLVWRVWRDGRTPASAAADRPRAGEAAVGYALSLVSVLVAAYHCNTDTLYAGLTLLSVWLLERRARPLAAGLALAAAVNVKLVPVIFVPALLLGCRSRREAGRFLAGLAVGVLPFVPVLLTAGEAFFRNAIAYGSRLDKWGVQLLLLPTGEDLPPEGRGGWADVYYAYGRWVMIGAVLAWAAAAWRLRRWDRYESAAVTAGLFLLLAPGFAVQYAAVPVPLLLAARPRAAHAYALAAGAFLAAAYYTTLSPSPADPQVPLFSFFRAAFRPPAPALGAVTWLVLAYATGAIMWKVGRVKPGAGSRKPEG